LQSTGSLGYPPQAKVSQDGQCIGLYVCAERKDSLRIQLLSVERENFSIQSMKPMTLLKGDIEECDSPDEATEQRAREQAKSCKPSKEPR